MAPSKKKKWVAFKSNTPVPASVLGEKEDCRMKAGVPVLLPADYADHVVSDGYAVPCKAPKKEAVKDAVKKAVGAVVKKSAAVKIEQLEAAQAAVDAAQSALMDAEGTDDADDARRVLLAAQQALAALQA